MFFIVVMYSVCLIVVIFSSAQAHKTQIVTLCCVSPLVVFFREQ